MQVFELWVLLMLLLQKTLLLLALAIEKLFRRRFLHSLSSWNQTEMFLPLHFLKLWMAVAELLRMKVRRAQRVVAEQAGKLQCAKVSRCLPL